MQTAQELKIAGKGHNKPPSEAEILKGKLEERHFDLVTEASELVSALDAHKAPIKDDEGAAKVTDFISKLSACKKSLDARRKEEKEPFLSGGRTVDAFFNGFVEGVDKAKSTAQIPLNLWLQKKAEEERKAQLEEAERLKKQAEQLAQAAANFEEVGLVSNSENALDGAVAAEEMAKRAEQLATGKPASLAKSRGGSGVASLRTRWVGEIVDIKAVDLEALRPHIAEEAIQKAINSFIACNGRELKGVKIYEKTDAVVRG